MGSSWHADLEELFDPTLNDNDVKLQRVWNEYAARPGYRCCRAIKLAGRTRSMEHAALDIENCVAGVDCEMRGTVTIIASEGVGFYWLVPRLLGFQRRHPGIGISLGTSNDLQKLENSEADIALRFDHLAEMTSQVHKVADLALLPYALKTSLRELGRPKRIKKSKDHYMVDRNLAMRGPAWQKWTSAVAIP